jgi:hypothetical protein
VVLSFLSLRSTSRVNSVANSRPELSSTRLKKIAAGEKFSSKKKLNAFDGIGLKLKIINGRIIGKIVNKFFME